MKYFILIIFTINILFANTTNDNKKIFLGNINYKPLMFEKDNIANGLIVELTNAVINEANINAEVKLMDWAIAQDKLNNNEADALIQINKNPQREKIYSFSNPLFKSSFYIYKKSTNYKLFDLKSMEGKTIGVEKKGYPISLIKKNPLINIKILKSWEEGFKLVSEGEIDGIVLDDTLGDYILYKNNIIGINKSFVPLKIIYSHIAVKKDDIELLEKINNGLKLIDEKNIRNEILTKWDFNLFQNKSMVLNSKEIDYIKKTKEIKVCTQYNSYPETGVIDNKIVGVMGDILDEISKNTSLKFKGINVDSNEELNQKVQNHQCDIVSYVVKNQKIFPNIITTNTFHEQNISLIGNINHEFISNPLDLTNSKIYSRLKITKKLVEEKYPYLDIQLEPDLNKIMEKIKSNNNTFLIANSTTADSYVVNYGYENYKIISELNEVVFKSAFGVDRKNPILLNILNKSLELIPKEKILDIYNKYEVKKFILKNNSKLEAYLLYILASVIVFLILFIYRAKLLSNKNNIIEEKNKQLEYLAKQLKESLIEANESKELAILEKEKAQSAYEEATIAEEKAISTQNELLEVQEELIKANDSKSQFLANMSHEIRTPLNGIIGITDILLEKQDLDKNLKENLEIIQRSSNSLRGIINDILDFTKIQAGKFDIKANEFSLSALLNEIKELYHPLAIQNELQCDMDIDEKCEDTLIGDELRLKQILTNLIGNSIKFTKVGSVKLKLKTTYKEGERIHIRFEIKDTGIGMSQAVKDNLFKEFTQGELSNTKEYQGTGLGLAITKSLVELMGGSIRFESIEGYGTTFYLNIPFKFIKDKKIESKTKSQSLYLNKLKKALVAEDVSTNQIVINNKLMKMGFKVDFANDGLQAIEMAKINYYDIIFMDIQMPNMDGFEATKEIRKFNKNIPIIALSAAVMQEDKTKTISSGMNDHIGKPILNEDLNKIVQKYFDTSSNDVITQKEVNNISDFNFKEIHQNLINEYDEDTVKIIFENLYDEYKNFEETIKNSNEEEFKRLIHKLKGAMGNMGIASIYEVCKDIEKTKKNDKLVEKLIHDMNTLIKNIKESDFKLTI